MADADLKYPDIDHIGKTYTFLILWLVLLSVSNNIIPSFSNVLYVFQPTDLELSMYYYYNWQRGETLFYFICCFF